MQNQRELLQTPWNAILLMDAARYDVAHAVWDGFRQVTALGGITHLWCKALWGMVSEPIVHFTANPVVTYAWMRYGRPGHVEVVDVWRTMWKEYPPHKLGTVVAGDVNEFVEAWISEHGTPGRILVHYLQPHAPYIKRPLPIRTGNITQGPTPTNDIAIPDAIRLGKFGWKDLRDSYRGNMEMAVTHSRRLAEKLEGRVIITSDHGEALGEGGRFGHGGGISWDLLKKVPWWAKNK